MTMDVDAQLQQRVDREHGRAFDALVRQARDRFYGDSDTPDEASIGNGIGNEPELPCPSGAQKAAQAKKKALLAGPFEVARPGLEPGTPRFSVVCSTN